LRSSPVRNWRGAIAYRTAFVHPSIDLAPKVVDEQRRFDRFAIRISRIRNSRPDFSARLILLHERLICHGSPLHLLFATMQVRAAALMPALSYPVVSAVDILRIIA
jgi:hypothetical protein